MEPITPIFAVISGIVIRLALPIAITAIAIRYLKHLDNRWQAEAEELLLLPAVEKPKCWEVHNCPHEKRESCPGYQSQQPCWQAHRMENGYLREPCLGCDVFLKAPVPVNI